MTITTVFTTSLILRTTCYVVDTEKAHTIAPTSLPHRSHIASFTQSLHSCAAHPIFHLVDTPHYEYYDVLLLRSPFAFLHRVSLTAWSPALACCHTCHGLMQASARFPVFCSGGRSPYNDMTYGAIVAGNLFFSLLPHQKIKREKK